LANYAYLIGGNYPSVTTGGAGSENIFLGVATFCQGSSCNPGLDVTTFHGGSFGINLYLDPNFHSTADLLANHMGAPNCSGFANVTACMGWDGTTLTPFSVIYDLTPTAAAAAGKGYQVPRACAADPEYPTWLKGIVYLRHLGGAVIVESAGLVQSLAICEWRDHQDRQSRGAFGNPGRLGRAHQGNASQCAAPRAPAAGAPIADAATALAPRGSTGKQAPRSASRGAAESR
jgi:hypothetical protein